MGSGPVLSEVLFPWSRASSCLRFCLCVWIKTWFSLRFCWFCVRAWSSLRFCLCVRTRFSLRFCLWGQGWFWSGSGVGVAHLDSTEVVEGVPSGPHDETQGTVRP